jgi:hypothetical protein
MSSRSRDLYQTCIKRGFQKEDAFYGPLCGIPLNQDKVAWVDPRDYEWLSQGKWTAQKGGKTHYASRNQWANGKPKKIYMHRLIMSAPRGVIIDHRNRDGLCNARANLRSATKSTNGANGIRTSTRHKGVYPNGSKWQARIKVNYQQLYLGTFTTEEEAARAYDAAAIKYFGEFATPNFPAVATHGQ